MTEQTALNRSEFVLYTDDVGSDRRASDERPSIRSSYKTPIAAGTVLLFLVGGGIATHSLTRTEKYPVPERQTVPIVREAPDIKRPELPMARESYAASMEEKAPVAKDELDGKYPVRELRKAIWDYGRRHSGPRMEELKPEILSVKEIDNGVYSVEVITKGRYNGRVLKSHNSFELRMNGDKLEIVSKRVIK